MKAIEIELGGARRRLALDLNAEIALQEREGLDIGELLRRFQNPQLETGSDDPKQRAAVNLERAKLTRVLAWAALQTATDGKVTLTEVGSWINAANLTALMTTLSDAISEAFGVKEEFEGQLAPFVPTPEAVVQAMVRMAGISEGARVVDLGAGDGRLLFAAHDAAADVSCTGYEMHPGRFEALRDGCKGKRVRVLREDIAVVVNQEGGSVIELADVVFLYLLDSSNMLLRDKLRARMKPGARIISHDFRMGDWEPEASETVIADRTHKVYRWVI